MEYLGYVISGLVLLVGIIFMVQGYKKYNTSLQQIILQKQNDLAEAVHNEQDTYNKLVVEAAKEQKKLNDLIDRAADASKLAENYQQLSKGAIDHELQIYKEQQLSDVESYRQCQLARVEQAIQQKEDAFNLYYQKERAKKEAKLRNQQSQIDEWQAKLDSINAAALRQRELEEKEDFYSIQVPQNDRDDIKILQSMDLQLHNRNVIPKLIWELFIRRPTQEMIKRVTNGRECSGIYKVTNKQTGESYIGRSSNIPNRWQNHLKTAVGLEGAAASTFHTRLAHDGLWNYTWEILEEAPKEKLSEREAFYIELYGTKNQLNQKAGG